MARDTRDRIRRAGEAVVGAARSMRRTPTPAERVLWRGLRGRLRNGLKFRRQCPVGPFVLDFYCPALKLAIEVDGAIHQDQLERDEARTASLRATGYTVVRFTNDQVLDRLPWVLARIDEVAATLRSETPLPFMGEGGEPKRAG